MLFILCDVRSPFCCLLCYLLAVVTPYISKSKVSFHGHTQSCLHAAVLLCDLNCQLGLKRTHAIWWMVLRQDFIQPQQIFSGCTEFTFIHYTCSGGMNLFFSLFCPFPHCPLKHLCSALFIFTTGPCRERPRKSLLTAPTDSWSLHCETELSRSSRTFSARREFVL